MDTSEIIDPKITAIAEAIATSISEKAPKQIAHIHTDGSCLQMKNKGTGPGGWAAHIEVNGQVTTLSGSAHRTTNNQMELMAIIQALRNLKKASRVLLYSDSKYCVDMIAKRWINSWHKNGWKTSGWKGKKPKPIANQELVAMLWDLLKHHDVKATWVKAHNGHELNELVDDLAQEQARSLL